MAGGTTLPLIAPPQAKFPVQFAAGSPTTAGLLLDRPPRLAASGAGWPEAQLLGDEPAPFSGQSSGIGGESEDGFEWELKNEQEQYIHQLGEPPQSDTGPRSGPLVGEEMTPHRADSER